MQEKRVSPRVDVSFPIECSKLSQRGYFYTVSKDLSLGGVKIYSDEFLPKDNYVKVNINLVPEVVGVKAKVVWCAKERVSERYSAGLQFLELSETKKSALAQFLNKIYNS